MQLDAKMTEKVEALALLLEKRPEQVVDEALDLYLQYAHEQKLEAEMDAHRKETNLSYEEFWDDLDLDE